ncbi:MAG: COX15/CtaA family protein [Bacteroidota bacterium]
MSSVPFYKSVGFWLWIGVFMVFMQVVIGGITRLTASGLSITKWEIVTGTLPPMNAKQWQEEFDLYKETPQYKKINEGMSMGEFKFIYFWEYIHRLWARTMGFVFLIPFLIFLYRKRLDRKLIRQLMIVVFLAAIVASLGWIMVASGLINRPWVNAYKLTIHLSSAIIVYAYLFWITMDYWLSKKRMPTPQNEEITEENLTLDSEAATPSENNKLFFHNPVLKRLIIAIIALLSVQIVIGGLMSGMKAGIYYPTFPKMGEEWLPSVVFKASNWNVENFVNYDVYLFMPALVQLTHRFTAFLLVFIVLWLLYKASKFRTHYTFKLGLNLLTFMLVMQILLGILTVISCKGSIPVTLGVFHQIGALLLLTSALFVYYPVHRSKP